MDLGTTVNTIRLELHKLLLQSKATNVDRAELQETVKRLMGALDKLPNLTNNSQQAVTCSGDCRRMIAAIIKFITVKQAGKEDVSEEDAEFKKSVASFKLSFAPFQQFPASMGGYSNTTRGTSELILSQPHATLQHSYSSPSSPIQSHKANSSPDVGKLNPPTPSTSTSTSTSTSSSSSLQQPSPSRRPTSICNLSTNSSRTPTKREDRIKSYGGLTQKVVEEAFSNPPSLSENKGNVNGKFISNKTSEQRTATTTTSAATTTPSITTTPTPTAPSTPTVTPTAATAIATATPPRTRNVNDTHSSPSNAVSTPNRTNSPFHSNTPINTHPNDVRTLNSSGGAVRTTPKATPTSPIVCKNPLYINTSHAMKQRTQSVLPPLSPKEDNANQLRKTVTLNKLNDSQKGVSGEGFQWEYLKSGSVWAKYDSLSNKLIERAYREKKSEVVLSHDWAEKDTYTIIFRTDKTIQKNNVTGFWKYVRRGTGEKSIYDRVPTAQALPNFSNYSPSITMDNLLNPPTPNLRLTPDYGLEVMNQPTFLSPPVVPKPAFDLNSQLSKLIDDVDTTGGGADIPRGDTYKSKPVVYSLNTDNRYTENKPKPPPLLDNVSMNLDPVNTVKTSNDSVTSKRSSAETFITKKPETALSNYCSTSAGSVSMLEESESLVEDSLTESSHEITIGKRSPRASGSRSPPETPDRLSRDSSSTAAAAAGSKSIPQSAFPIKKVNNSPYKTNFLSHNHSQFGGGGSGFVQSSEDEFHQQVSVYTELVDSLNSLAPLDPLPQLPGTVDVLLKLKDMEGEVDRRMEALRSYLEDEDTIRYEADLKKRLEEIEELLRKEQCEETY